MRADIVEDRDLRQAPASEPKWFAARSFGRDRADIAALPSEERLAS